MLNSGLVSITFRQLSPREIVELVAAAGLDGIEWGGDVHVPHGNPACAREVRAMTADAGLSVAAYGSYYRVAEGGEPRFDAVLETAVELGAPVIRVWAGRKGSVVASAAERAAIEDESRALAAQAATAGVAVAYEFHGNTLTDTTESALRLLQAVDHPNLYTYWQPPGGLALEELRESLRAVRPYVGNLHVFHWSDGGREALAAGREKWRTLLTELRGAPARRRFAMIEFVKDDSPEQFKADAAALLELLGEI